MNKLEIPKIKLEPYLYRQFRNQRGLCHLCSIKMVFDYSLNPYSVTRDHVTPASQGGQRFDWAGKSNLLLAHSWCNSDRKNRTIYEYTLLGKNKFEKQRRKREIDEAHCRYLFYLYDKERLARHAQRVDCIFQRFGIGIEEDERQSGLADRSAGQSDLCGEHGPASPNTDNGGNGSTHDGTSAASLHYVGDGAALGEVERRSDSGIE